MDGRGSLGRVRRRALHDRARDRARRHGDGLPRARLKHDRRVALKVLDPELGAVLGAERFLAEIKVTANLQHPNLLPLFDSGEADGLLFYVMPFVEGESLRARLDRERQLPVDEAVRIAAAVASALDYAHRHGVIHRDLKPENILLHEGQPLVADFGIALAVSNAGGARVTQTGLSLGTPQYMSPEQATGDRGIDGRTDIYSLGAVLYEMLTGEPPHTGTTAQAIIARVLTETPRSVRAQRSSVPEHVENAIDRALAKLPADRWSRAQEFADALTGKSDVSSSGARRTRPVARWRTPVVALLAAVAGAPGSRRFSPPRGPQMKNRGRLSSLTYDDDRIALWQGVTRTPTFPPAGRPSSPGGFRAIPRPRFSFARSATHIRASSKGRAERFSQVSRPTGSGWPSSSAGSW